MTDTLIAVGERNGHVVFTFPHPTDEISFDPPTASKIAEETARCAYKATNGKLPPQGHSEVAKQVRVRMDETRKVLHGRVGIVLRTLLEEGRTAEYIAMKLTDIIMSEVA